MAGRSVARDDLGHDGVPGRGVHGVAQAHAEGKRQQVPGVELAEEGQHGQVAATAIIQNWQTMM
jgi:hypothetical protein